MRILFLTFYYPPDVCAGAFRSEPLVEALRRHGGENIHIDVLTTFPNRYASFDVSADPVEESHGVTVRRFRIAEHQSGMLDQSRAFLDFGRQVMKAVRGERWDLVFATSSRLMTAALGATIARRSETPLYLDIRDLFTDILDDLLGPVRARIISPALKMVERTTFRTAKRINLVSPGFEDHVARIVGHRDFSFHTNGIDQTFVDWSPRPPDNGKAFTVLYAGNIGEGQGLHRIVPDAAALLTADAQFRIIGDGGQRTTLESRVQDLGLENVEVLDPIPRSRLLEEYGRCDALLLHLNDYQAFRKVLPSKVFEYGASGRPILAGVSGYAARFVERELPDSFLFDPCDVKSLVAGIRSLGADQRTHDRTEFRRQFDRRAIMERMAEDILATPGRAG